MRSALLALALLFALAPSAPSAEFALKDGDRVVFYGDSITDQRLYTTYVEAYVVTRFPKRDVRFVHSGWGGDRVGGGGGGPVDVRLSRDVVAYKPTVVTIMLGMNDASYQPFNDKIFGAYSKGYEHIVETLQKDLPGVRLTLIQPSPFDDVTRKPNFEGGYNKVLLRYGDFVKELAGKRGATVADLNTGLVEATKKADQSNHDLAIKFNQDRVHPGPAGQLLMAESLLKAWDAPSVVSSVELDGAAASSVKSENAKVRDLVFGDSVSWMQEDDALPFPIPANDPAVELAVQSSDFLSALDRQILKVANLKAATYSLKIDDKEIGKFSREDLASGINLATRDTPMSQQARRVLAMILEHNNLHFTAWRQMPGAPTGGDYGPAYNDAFAALLKLEAEVVKKGREAALPKPHKFELSPAA